MKTREPSVTPSWVSWMLGALLLVAIAAAALPAVLTLLSRDRIEYVTTEVVYVQGAAVEWDVYLTIRGESVRAMFSSEREAMRLRDAVEVGR